MGINLTKDVKDLYKENYKAYVQFKKQFLRNTHMAINQMRNIVNTPQSAKPFLVTALSLSVSF